MRGFIMRLRERLLGNYGNDVYLYDRFLSQNPIVEHPCGTLLNDCSKTQRVIIVRVYARISPYE